MLQLCRLQSKTLSKDHVRLGSKARLIYKLNKCAPLTIKTHGSVRHLHLRKQAQTTCISFRMSGARTLHFCSCSMSNKKTHYEVLGLAKTATREDIRAAFLQRSKECHPDLNKLNPENHRKFVQVNEAYSVLSRPQSRQHYDISLDHSLYSSHLNRTSPHSAYHYHRARDFSEKDWLKNNGLKEEYFRQNSYHHYGQASLNRVSNFHIVASCLVFMTAGILFHIFAVKRSTEKHIKNLDDRDLRTHEMWMKAKKDAKEFTPRELTQHLFEKQEKQRDPPM